MNLTNILTRLHQFNRKIVIYAPFSLFMMLLLLAACAGNSGNIVAEFLTPILIVGSFVVLVVLLISYLFYIIKYLHMEYKVEKSRLFIKIFAWILVGGSVYIGGILLSLAFQWRIRIVLDWLSITLIVFITLSIWKYALADKQQVL